MPDEDFRLFLRSIYECSEELLNRIDEETGRVHDSEYKIIYQAELAYLLAQQFTATSDTLGNIRNIYNHIYSYSSMIPAQSD